MQPVVVQSGGCRGVEGRRGVEGKWKQTQAAPPRLTSSDLPVIAAIMLQMKMVNPHEKKENNWQKNRKVSENADWGPHPPPPPPPAPFNQPSTSEWRGRLGRSLLPGARRSAGTLLILICLSIWPGSDQSASLSEPSIRLLLLSWAAAGPSIHRPSDGRMEDGGEEGRNETLTGRPNPS